jgi:DNA-binding SARP family transcriptional activator
MRTLLDFLNHGALPFTGREGEMERLLSFWRSTPEANGLRAMLLVGEAGIGKSRLIEELIPQIHSAGGLVVHAKILPESTASIVPLVARALWYSEAGRHLLKKEPEDNLGSVLGGLRRLSRLRPTLLVIEDIHLLQGGPLGELWHLLDGLADETLSLLCDARPLDLEARGLLERFLVEEIELEGLRDKALEGLWNDLFAAPADGAIIAMLEEATAGNPLAIRSALRGALASGAIAQGSGRGGARGAPGPVRFDRGRFAQGLKRDVTLLSEGMAAHLSADEKEIAGRLALLGEAFARETANELLEGADEAIERLIFRGILGISPTPSAPLVGPSMEIPDFPATTYPLLSFTHTLLHRYFADRAVADAASLIRIVGSDLPLYSILPIQLLGASHGGAEAGAERLRGAVARTRFVALELSTSPDWRAAMPIWTIARELASRFDDVWSPEVRREIESGLIMVRLSILANEGIGDEYHELTDRLLELTANPATTQDAARRIAALAKFHATDLDAVDLSRTIWHQGEELVERFPDLRFTHSYGLFLALVASSAIETKDNGTARLAEARLREIAGDERGHELGSHLRGWILSSCITVFDSEEELVERLRLLDELEHAIEGSQQELMLRMGKLLLLDAIGFADDLARSVEDSLPRFREYNWTGSLFKALAMRARMSAAIGMELDDVESLAMKLAGDPAEDSRATARIAMGAYLPDAGLLAGNPAWALHIAATFPEGEELIGNASAILLALERGMLPRELPQRIGDDDRAAHALLELLAPLQAASDKGERGDEHDAAALGRELLAFPILRVTDLLRLHATIALLERLGSDAAAPAVKLRSAIHDALLRAVEWLAERRLPAYMHGLLDRHAAYYTAKELKGLRSRTAAMMRERRTELSAARGDGRIRISMLGTISIELPGMEAQRVQGARLRAVLGLMVANRMMERPLTGREFNAIATGEEIPERARNVVYVKLHSLREMLGEHAIVTETDKAPQLDDACVQVDLLDAHNLLAEAREAMREGALLRAYPALRRALELARGEVPFPGLYEEFFEAAREDFENALRNTAITVMRGLLREDDLQSAEEIARRTFDAIPDDEEIGEILCEALSRRGKRTEAERIRMRAAEAAA